MAAGRALPEWEYKSWLYYWRRVLRRAWKDARQAIGHNWIKTVVSSISMALAFGIFGFLEGGQQVWGKIEWWLSVLLGGLIVFVVILLYQILSAPLKLEAQAVAAVSADSAELQARLQEARDQISKLQDAKAKQAEALAIEKEVLRKEIEEARTSDPKRNALRFKIQQFIDKFNELYAQATSGHDIPAADFVPLECDAKNCLDRNLPEYDGFSAEYPVRDAYGVRQVLPSDQACLRFQARIRRLQEALSFLG